MSNITIDGRSVAFPPGATVLETALANGIDIPRLCYHPALKPSGGCRLCLVEIEGRPNPAPSCGLACEEGMVVRTQSEQLTRMRRDIIELFVSEHPLDCATCDKDGACDLQKYADQYGLTETSFDFELSRTLLPGRQPVLRARPPVLHPVRQVRARLRRDRGHERHRLCRPRLCEPHRHTLRRADGGLLLRLLRQLRPGLPDRRAAAQAAPRPGPRGGLHAAAHHLRLLRCRLQRGVRDARTSRSSTPGAIREAPVNGEFLCVKGRSGWDFVSSPERLTQPMVRKDLAYELGLTAEPWQLPNTSAAQGAGP